MPGPRSGRVAALLASAVALTLPGCGLPGSSDVIVRGEVQRSAPVSDDAGTWEPPGRDATTVPQDFVKNFLAAPAGEPSRAQARVRRFLAPEADEAWRPADTVHVARLVGEPIINRRPSGYDVQLQVEHLGELADNGAVVPRPRAAARYRFSFAEGERGDNSLYVTAALPLILLQDAVLRQYYESRPVYFWSADETTLVPDMRYLPRRDVTAAQIPTQILDWMLGGPVPWLRPAVRALPPGAARRGNVPAPTRDRIEVTLSKAVDTDRREQVDKLATQLRWSLGDSEQTLRLRVDEFQADYGGADYQRANAAYRGSRPVTAMAVLGGRPRPIGASTPGLVVPPELPSGYRLARRAAYTMVGVVWSAAIVRPAGGKDLGLDLAFGSEAGLEPPRPTSLRARSVGRPVWIRGGRSGLVAADGRLYSFRAGKQPRATPVAGAPVGRVGAVAVAPDGQRVALLVGGVLYVAALGADDAPVGIGPAQRVPVALGGLTAVDFSEEGRLVVAGRLPDGRAQLVDVTLDGALQTPRAGQFGAAAITQLVALPSDPTSRSGPGPVLYEANGLAYELYSVERRLTAEDVGVPGSTAYPSAPFFVT
ncbi:LpqB family beta-propeller domain-containing protein [Pilimelia columellifera]|uniref:GerMN domain-containing protein n=1 Tax=Pilimelia columellifera subsp. columellifera TaxID=706583 RepID=A0ABN3NJ17_9ACTN